MRDDIEKFTAAGASIVVVAKHSTKEMAEYWKENALPFTGIPDPEATLAKQYQQQWKALKLGLMPAMFVIEKNGKVAFVHYSAGMSDIPENKTVLAELKKLGSD
jgi:peroxiredoxin